MRGRIIVLVLTSPPVVSLISSYSRARSWWACALAPHFITPLSTLWIGFVQQERFFPGTVLAKRSYYGAKTVADGRTIISRAEAIISAAACRCVMLRERSWWRVTRLYHRARESAMRSEWSGSRCQDEDEDLMITQLLRRWVVVVVLLMWFLRQF